MISQSQNKSTKRYSQPEAVSNRFLGQKGQIVLEYVLILTVTVALASFIVSSMVKRSENADERGFIINSWVKLIDVIASDV